MLLAEARAAERLQSVVRQVPSSPAAGVTNAVKTIRIAGTVVDSAGKPLAGAVVECYQYDSGYRSFTANEMRVKQRVTTGTDGAFECRVPANTSMLVVRKPGLAPGWRQFYSLSNHRTEERVILTPPSSIKGIVVDESDDPVAGVEVWLSYACAVVEPEEERRTYNYLTGKPLRDCFSARTAADGTFVIQGFPTNASAEFAVGKSGKVVRSPQRDGISPDTMQYQPGQRDLKLVLDPAGSIEGKVMAKETGQLLAGFSLWAQPTRGGYYGREPRPAESGADGIFRLPDLPAGSYSLHARFGTNEPQEWVAETVPVTVESGQTTRDVQVSATRGGFLEVTVIGKTDQQLIGGASINAYKEAYQGGTGSGSNGIALLRLPAGEYSVHAYKEGARSERNEATVEEGRTNQLQIELAPAPKVAGLIRDPSGAAAAGVRVSVFPNWGNEGGEIKTDAQGHYELAWDPQRYGGSDRSHCLMAWDPNRNLATAQELEEGTTKLDLRLEPGLTLVGRVEDGNGKALSKASVRTVFWVGNSGWQFPDKPTRTDARGRFEVAGLPSGRRFSLNATAKGYGSASRNIPEESETNRVEVETCVLMIADRKLAGEVIDADEKPAARAWVHMYGDGQPQGSTRTDEKGRFGFDAVCEGTINVSASLRSAYGNARAQAGDTNVVIRLGVSRSYSSSSAPSRSSLKGKPLPNLAVVELNADAVPAGKPVLLCLFDVEQRPSRRFVKQLAEQLDSLQQKGLVVLGLQASITTPGAFKEWKQSNPLAFAVGRVTEKADKTKWAWQVESLPWLILTDSECRVTAEGFALEELDAKLKALSE